MVYKDEKVLKMVDRNHDGISDSITCMNTHSIISRGKILVLEAGKKYSTKNFSVDEKSVIDGLIKKGAL